MEKACGVADVRSAVVLRALPGLGDLLCWIPAMRALRTGMPHARIVLVGLASAHQVLDRFEGLVDEIVEFPGWPGLPEGSGDTGAITRFLHRVQGERFDLALQMHGSGLLTNPLVALFGAGRVAGFHLPGAFRPDPDLSLPYPGHAHEIHRHLVLTSALGLPEVGDELTFPIGGQDTANANALLAAEGVTQPFALVHPGSSFPSRRWEPRRFAAVADGLHERGLQVLLTGVESERQITSEVAATMRHPATDLTGRTALGTLGALVERAHLVVCNDTGISHLAAATRTPSVVVFMRSDPQRWAPLDRVRHRALCDEAVEANRCRHDDGGHRCLADGCRLPAPRPFRGRVAVDDVLREADVLLARPPVRRLLGRGSRA